MKFGVAIYRVAQKSLDTRCRATDSAKWLLCHRVYYRNTKASDRSRNTWHISEIL